MLALAVELVATTMLPPRTETNLGYHELSSKAPTMSSKKRRVDADILLDILNLETRESAEAVILNLMKRFGIDTAELQDESGFYRTDLLFYIWLSNS